MTKSATAVLKTLKEELEAESPEQVLEKVQSLKATSQALTARQADARGPLAVTLCLERASTKYIHGLLGIKTLEDINKVQGMLNHFQREILRPLLIEATVQERLKNRQEGQDE